MSMLLRQHSGSLGRPSACSSLVLPNHPAVRPVIKVPRRSSSGSSPTGSLPNIPTRQHTLQQISALQTHITSRQSDSDASSYIHRSHGCDGAESAQLTPLNCFKVAVSRAVMLKAAAGSLLRQVTAPMLPTVGQCADEGRRYMLLNLLFIMNVAHSSQCTTRSHDEEARMALAEMEEQAASGAHWLVRWLSDAAPPSPSPSPPPSPRAAASSSGSGSSDCCTEAAADARQWLALLPLPWLGWQSRLAAARRRARQQQQQLQEEQQQAERLRQQQLQQQLRALFSSQQAQAGAAASFAPAPSSHDSPSFPAAAGAASRPLPHASAAASPATSASLSSSASTFPAAPPAAAAAPQGAPSPRSSVCCAALPPSSGFPPASASSVSAFSAASVMSADSALSSTERAESDLDAAASLSLSLSLPLSPGNSCSLDMPLSPTNTISSSYGSYGSSSMDVVSSLSLDLPLSPANTTSTISCGSMDVLFSTDPQQQQRRCQRVKHVSPISGNLEFDSPPDDDDDSFATPSCCCRHSDGRRRSHSGRRRRRSHH